LQLRLRWLTSSYCDGLWIVGIQALLDELGRDLLFLLVDAGAANPVFAEFGNHVGEWIRVLVLVCLSLLLVRLNLVLNLLLVAVLRDRYGVLNRTNAAHSVALLQLLCFIARGVG
jgi:hypothetical protein